MEYVCDAPGGTTWFLIETEAEAIRESALMGHAVEKHYRQAKARASAAYVPMPGPFFEQEIGLKAHLRRTMPRFFTLRDAEGGGLATAMVPWPEDACPIIVGPGNRDPYIEQAAAIRTLAAHLGRDLDRARCYPYGR
ncbi:MULTISPECIES: hypothetical protein [Methylobacterium]|jgi:hypothetical protein|uniref:Uncharacterized protein n=1 Tax=Methylobacterium isbiliense TaxID=315478 RepID=A0ABQ4SFD1_9HYPH|nr:MULTISPECIES: hypothetical protein [Methylobacterium]MBY0297969.1 hypothetical protein [Methylobacterium sp.]MDN3627457.1 hypothetical protein [Methylobacterium isbiliense]GJE01210.1 hypothetical protein GMJLKIPL_3139 [Methylobacterium isbiliense]